MVYVLACIIMKPVAQQCEKRSIHALKTEFV
nr:MAG TPA: calmodulin [Caudoviricetes sp.]